MARQRDTITTENGLTNGMVPGEMPRDATTEHRLTLREASRDGDGNVRRGEEVYRLAPDMLALNQDNVRDSYESPRAIAHIEGLMAAYERGDYVPPLLVQPVANENGRYVIIDGAHRKIAADRVVRERGLKLRLSCMAFRGNSTEQLMYMMTSAKGLALDEIEKARACRKLVNRGMSRQEIASAMGVTVTWVDSRILLADAEPEVHQAIRDGVIEASVAIGIVRESGIRAAQVIRRLAQKARQQGRRRVTGSVVNGPRLSPKTANALLDSLRTAYEQLDDEVIGKVSDWEAQLKSEGMSDDELKNTRIEISGAALMQLVRGWGVVRAFEEQQQIKEVRRIRRLEAREQEKAASEHTATGEREAPENHHAGVTERAGPGNHHAGVRDREEPAGHHTGDGAEENDIFGVVPLAAHQRSGQAMALH